MKFAKKTLIITTLLLAACNKNTTSGSPSNSGTVNPASEAQKVKEGDLNTDLSKQLENAVYTNIYKNLSGKSRVTKHMYFYKASLTPAEVSPEGEINLIMHMRFSQNNGVLNMSVPLDAQTGVRIYTNGLDTDFFNKPEKLAGAPIFAEIVGKLDSKIQIGELVLNEKNNLDYKICELEYEDVCVSTLDLKSPIKGSALEKDLVSFPRLNPLSMFPYQAEFKINFKQKNNISGKTYFFYDIKNELK